MSLTKFSKAYCFGLISKIRYFFARTKIIMATFISTNMKRVKDFTLSKMPSPIAGNDYNSAGISILVSSLLDNDPRTKEASLDVIINVLSREDDNPNNINKKQLTPHLDDLVTNISALILEIDLNDDKNSLNTKILSLIALLFKESDFIGKQNRDSLVSGLKKAKTKIIKLSFKPDYNLLHSSLIIFKNMLLYGGENFDNNISLLILYNAIIPKYFLLFTSAKMINKDGHKTVYGDEAERQNIKSQTVLCISLLARIPQIEQYLLKLFPKGIENFIETVLDENQIDEKTKIDPKNNGKTTTFPKDISAPNIETALKWSYFLGSVFSKNFISPKFVWDETSRTDLDNFLETELENLVLKRNLNKDAIYNWKSAEPNFENDRTKVLFGDFYLVPLLDKADFDHVGLSKQMEFMEDLIVEVAVSKNVKEIFVKAILFVYEKIEN
ncbi:DnaJ subfamily C member 13, partial [Bonamia ostreae]